MTLPLDDEGSWSSALFVILPLDGKGSQTSAQVLSTGDSTSGWQGELVSVVISTVGDSASGWLRSESITDGDSTNWLSESAGDSSSLEGEGGLRHS